MGNPDFIKYIESIQKRLDIPECFELSQELLRSEKTIDLLLTRILTNTANVGDKYAMMEIIKQWLAMQKDDIRDCDNCIHKVSYGGVFSSCELWDCEYKQKEDKDDK